MRGARTSCQTTTRRRMVAAQARPNSVAHKTSGSTNRQAEIPLCRRPRPSPSLDIHDDVLSLSLFSSCRPESAPALLVRERGFRQAEKSFRVWLAFCGKTLWHGAELLHVSGGRHKAPAARRERHLAARSSSRERDSSRNPRVDVSAPPKQQPLCCLPGKHWSIPLSGNDTAHSSLIASRTTRLACKSPRSRTTCAIAGAIGGDQQYHRLVRDLRRMRTCPRLTVLLGTAQLSALTSRSKMK